MASRQDERALASNYAPLVDPSTEMQPLFKRKRVCWMSAARVGSSCSERSTGVLVCGLDFHRVARGPGASRFGPKAVSAKVMNHTAPASTQWTLSLP